jgi:hypothetical protein
MQHQVFLVQPDGSEKRLFEGLAYCQSTQDQINLRMNDICNRYNLQEFKVAEDFGCSKGKLSLLKQGKYGSEHGKDHLYATMFHNTSKYNALLHFYDLLVVLQLFQFLSNNNLSKQSIVEPCFQFIQTLIKRKHQSSSSSSKQRLLKGEVLDSLKSAFGQEKSETELLNCVEKEFSTQESVFEWLRQFVTLSLPLNKRKFVEDVLENSVKNPKTKMRLNFVPPRFKHSQYKTNLIPFRLGKDKIFGTDKIEPFDKLLWWLLAVDSPAEEAMDENWTDAQKQSYMQWTSFLHREIEKPGQGWTLEQWLVYLQVKNNFDSIPVGERVPVRIYTSLPNIGTMPADEAYKYLPKHRSSSIAAFNSARDRVNEHGIAPPAPRRIRDPVAREERRQKREAKMIAATLKKEAREQRRKIKQENNENNNNHNHNHNHYNDDIALKKIKKENKSVMKRKKLNETKAQKKRRKLSVKFEEDSLETEDESFSDENLKRKTRPIPSSSFVVKKEPYDPPNFQHHTNTNDFELKKKTILLPFDFSQFSRSSFTPQYSIPC